MENFSEVEKSVISKLVKNHRDDCLRQMNFCKNRLNENPNDKAFLDLYGYFEHEFNICLEIIKKLEGEK